MQLLQLFNKACLTCKTACCWGCLFEAVSALWSSCRCCPETASEYKVAASTALALGLRTAFLKGLLPLASFKCIQWDAVVPPLLQVTACVRLLLHTQQHFMEELHRRWIDGLNRGKLPSSAECYKGPTHWSSSPAAAHGSMKPNHAGL